MVDHIHFPRSISPLFQTGKVKKVERRKDKREESGFKESLDQEKKSGEASEDEDGYTPDEQEDGAEQAAERRKADGPPIPDEAPPDLQGEDRTFGRKIDVHA